jgi:Family of unknown function (DUF6490)
MDATSNAGADDISKPLQLQQESQRSNSNRFLITLEFLPTIGFLFLTYNFATATYRSRNNPSDLAFIISCYVELILLFCCLKKHENLSTGTPTEQSNRLKGAVWVLSTLLTCTFTWRVSQIMPWYLNLIMWSMSASVIVVGFYFFFLFKGEDAQLTNKYRKLILHSDNKGDGLCELCPEEKV